eukprot:CAMPEP_0178529646 /NCGR_PEP_ID=MMETSP0696-20121128/32440_1 /TAXON_ID=265572 /ORGANISM="Extubocellulus spinifer, Strain CCMP396" /LENGTH=654 /DNA_ID=CAMNT_0020161367 /DNA_START=147 /DNA_END=2111 /DNA_ORIENTATION=-
MAALSTDPSNSPGSRCSCSGAVGVSAFVPPTSSSSGGRSAAITAGASRSSRIANAIGVGSEYLNSLSGLQMSTAAPPEKPPSNDETVPLPEMDSDGLYNIENADQHKAFLAANPDKIVVLKFYAPWCRACKGLAPKYLALKNDPKYEDLPILWSQMSVQHNKDYIKSLGVLALPSVLFYAGSEGLVENFPCGPSKIPIFKKKFADLLNRAIDPDTRKLKHVDCTLPEYAESEPCTTRPVVDKGPVTQLSVGEAVVSEEQWNHLRTRLPYFKDFSDEEFNQLMDKAVLETFEPGQVIMRQGMPGEKFYMIESGEVEILVRSAFEDPLTTPPNYLGAVVNRLGALEFFGERALITGEPRAASIRASEKTRCFAFHQNDIPSSSVLSGKRDPTPERRAQIDEKYALDFYNVNFIREQFDKANSASQKRGSANRPYEIPGVDNDDEIADLPADVLSKPKVVSDVNVNGNQDMIVALLMRFKLLRHASRCFEYIMGTQPKFGNPGEVGRRTLLVSKLSPLQREEFRNVYELIDNDNDGLVSVLELKRALESVGTERSDEEIFDMINKANPAIDGNTEISEADFMGVMAEAEFYYLFMETFSSLDKNNIGFLKASDLDQVLCGMRDLVSNDRKSIIDVDDQDMLINYEQFAKMLLGADAY